MRELRASDIHGLFATTKDHRGLLARLEREASIVELIAALRASRSEYERQLHCDLVVDLVVDLVGRRRA